MLVSEFDFDLPPERIARQPVEPRCAARLLVYDRAARECRHTEIRALPGLLRRGDLLVVNDTRVLPHRLVGRRATGGRVETLILARDGEECRGYLKPAAKVRLGEPLAMEGGALALTAHERLQGGLFRFRLQATTAGESVAQALERVGRAPLPPYLGRAAASEDVAADRQRYQTVFATAPGAVAAPTAGLHFTEPLLEALRQAGVETARVTLHVGEGTFAPVRALAVAEHRMHSERYELSQATADAVAETRARGGRVVAVGTTATRTLETCAQPGRLVAPGAGSSDLFLYPGKEFRVVDALLTNFHLPRSTLLMLVCAFAGHQETLALYRDAVARGYRFYSFGDATLLL